MTDESSEYEPEVPEEAATDGVVTEDGDVVDSYALGEEASPPATADESVPVSPDA